MQRHHFKKSTSDLSLAESKAVARFNPKMRTCAAQLRMSAMGQKWTYEKARNAGGRLFKKAHPCARFRLYN